MGGGGGGSSEDGWLRLEGGERGAGAQAGTPEPADGTHEAANGWRTEPVPRPPGPEDQGCQSPAATMTSPGAGTSAGTSKKRGVGPCSCGNWSISCNAARRWFSSPAVKKTVLAATSEPL